MAGHSAGFDRVRPRAGAAPRRGMSDPQGRRALYSTLDQPPPAGAVTVECSACGQTTPCTPQALLRLAIPSVHLPLLRRFPSWMRCPACGRRTWVRVGLRL